MKTKLPILLFILVCTVASFAQTKTNLEIVNDLIAHSVAKADSAIGGKQGINLAVTSAAALEVLKSKVYESFATKGYSLESGGNSALKLVEYNLLSARVEYKDSFSDGIFGGTMIQREISLDGSFIIKNPDKTVRPMQFHKLYSDTVRLDDISSLENKVLPFTQANLPSLPLLSNLWEPIIVTGTLIVTVILLFTVRSK